MINIKVDITSAVEGLNAKIMRIQNGSPVRAAALGLIGVMTERIHQDGIAADGSKIGTYSSAYLKYRSGVYENAATFKKGKNKGKRKDAGMFTKGVNKGKPRHQFKRGTDPKVVVSLTRQLENDWIVSATPKGWGVGFFNPLNLQKMKWVEKAKGKVIGSATTAEEKAFVISKIRERINSILNP